MSYSPPLKTMWGLVLTENKIRAGRGCSQTLTTPHQKLSKHEVRVPANMETNSQLWWHLLAPGALWSARLAYMVSSRLANKNKTQESRWRAIEQ